MINNRIIDGRFAPPAVPLCRAFCLSAPPAVLPIRRAGLPPPFCAIYKDARRKPPSAAVPSCLLLPAAAACCRLPRLPPSCSLPLLLDSSSIRHKYVRTGGGPAPRKRAAVAGGGVPLSANTSLRCLIAKFFIFYFLFFLEIEKPL